MQVVDVLSNSEATSPTLAVFFGLLLKTLSPINKGYVHKCEGSLPKRLGAYVVLRIPSGSKPFFSVAFPYDWPQCGMGLKSSHSSREM